MKDTIYYMIRDLSRKIFSRKEYFLYKGIKFIIQENKFSNPMDMRELVVLRILCPVPYMKDAERYINVTYEPDWRSRANEIDMRTEACERLATHFVMDVLPKVDFEMKKEITNYEVEKILEVLE